MNGNEQVDKADLIGFSQGPTLAELNANDESLLSDLNFDDFLLPSQHGQHAGHHHHHHNLGGASAGDGAPPTSAAIRYSKSNSSARLSEVCWLWLWFRFDWSTESTTSFPVSLHKSGQVWLELCSFQRPVPCSTSWSASVR